MSDPAGDRPDAAKASDTEHLLGQLAVRRGLITESQLESVLAEQATTHVPLGVLFVRRGLLTTSQLSGLLVLQRTGQLPELLGRYVVKERLGRGGMGEVLRGYDPATKREVALKVLAAERQEPKLLARLAHEARAIAQLAHPNIVTLYEANLEHVPPYLALELVDGTTLDDVVQKGRVPVRSAVALLRTVARAVEHAHLHGIIHRDLKPANILIDAAGAPKVTDFGLARIEQGATALTRTGTVMGTAHYMAPEQIRGERVGPPADVWSLGVILYQLLAADLPFMGETIQEVYERVLHEDPRPVRRGGSTVPSELDAVTMKCLDKDPRRRYQRAGELADELDRWLQGEPVRARPSSFITRVGKKLRKGRGLVGLVGAAGLVATIGVSLLLVQVMRTRSFDRARASALRAAGEGDWPRALAESERALEMRPDAVLAEVRDRARLKIAEEEREKRRLQLVEQMKPTVTAIEETRAFFYVKHIDIGKRLAELEGKLQQLEGIANDPRNADQAEAWILLGKGRYFVGDYARAEAALLRAEALVPEDGRVNFWLGRIYLDRAMGELLSSKKRSRDLSAKALTYLKRPSRGGEVGDLERDLAEVYALLAEEENEEVIRRCEAGRKRFARALGVEEYWNLEAWARGWNIDCWTKAIEMRPHYPWAHYMRGQARHVLLEDWISAIADYHEALKGNPRLTGAYYCRGISKYNLRNYKGAVEDCDKVIEIEPDSVFAYRLRASARLKLNNLDDAAADVDRAIALDPHDAECHVTRAQIRLRRGDRTGALADYDQAIANDPNEPETYWRRAELRRRAGDPEGAILDCEESLAIALNTPEAYHQRALARKSLRDDEGAVADLLRALAVAPAKWIERARVEDLLAEWRRR